MSDEENLRAFAKEIMDHWPESGVDGDDLQEIAVKHGLLAPTVKYKPCGENCSCADHAGTDEFKNGLVCFVKTKLLTGEEND